MTTDELERDLKTLAESRTSDERLRRAIRASLGDRLAVPPKRNRRTRLALGAVAAATVAAAIVALVGTGGSGGPSTANAAILGHVTRTLSPPANLIVHVRETGMDEGTPVSAEWWQETKPPYAFRLIKSAGDYKGEGADDGTRSSRYDAATDTIYQHPSGESPTLVDPIETVRAALANGTAQVAGTVTIDGRSLYKIELPTGVVGYFDRTDYRPVYLDNPQGDGHVVRTKVVAYEELPHTPGNEMLLSVAAQHPGARVETSPTPIK